MPQRACRAASGKSTTRDVCDQRSATSIQCSTRLGWSTGQISGLTLSDPSGPPHIGKTSLPQILHPLDFRDHANLAYSLYNVGIGQV